MNFKKCLISIMLLASVAVWADSFIPDSFSNTWTCSDSTGYMDTNTWLTMTTYMLTNNIVMVNANTTQDLTGLGIEIRAGDNVTNRLFRGVVLDGPNGRFSCPFMIPTTSPNSVRQILASVQLAITNSVGDRKIYRGQKQLTVVNPLQ